MANSINQLLTQCLFHFNMLECGNDKRIFIENTTYVLKVERFLLYVAVGTEAGLKGERELLACIAVDHLIKTYNALLPFPDNADYIGSSDGFR